jgi:uncharacterized protein YjbI with pentapeptide repeats
MAERGKYHGQRLKAKEVLRLYAAGERDFRGSILQGCNFRGADLSGADFSGADIRSARFVDTNLQKANFSHTKGGLQRRWIAVQLLLVVVIAALAGFLQGYSGGLIGYYFYLGFDDPDFLIAAIAGTVVIIVSFFAIACQGFTIRALGSIAVASAVAFVVAFVFAVAVAGTFASAVTIVAAVTVTGGGTGAGAGAGTVAVAVAGAVAVAVAVAFAVAIAGTFAGAGAVAFTVTAAGAVAVAVASAGAVAGAGTFAVAGAGAVALMSLALSVYINWRVSRSDPEFENLCIIGLAFAALGGTSFSGADLTNATFAYAHLKNTNFAASRQRPTLLNRVRWHGSEQLDRARIGNSNLQDSRVRQLVTTLNGIDQDFSNIDLWGTNLAGAQLHRANFKLANLNSATLQGAELQDASFRKAQCINTNFTGAHLTGACLENWNIGETTILKDIDCQYVFLKEKSDSYGNRERRPHNPDKVFEPGDFEKFFQEMLDTVQILIRQGIHPQVFKETFEQIRAKYDLSSEAIQGIEKKGDDVLVTMAVPAGTDKGQLEQDFDELQALKLEAAKTQGLLEGERKRADDLKAIMLGLTSTAPSVTVTTTAMNQSNNPNITTGDGSFYAGGDVNLSGSTINLGEISGQVSNQINQLPDAAPDQPNLKDLLTQLQAAVEADTELSEVEKKEALGEVAKLAEAGSQPKEGAMQRMAKRATAALKSITESLSDASKLATACKTLLPMILSVF